MGKKRYLEYIEKGPDVPFQQHGIEDGSPESEVGLSDTIGSQRNQEPESYKVFSEMLQRIAATNGIPATEVLGRDRGYTAVRARRELLQECKSRLNISIVQPSRWLGISQSAARYLLNSDNSVIR